MVSFKDSGSVRLIAIKNLAPIFIYRLPSGALFPNAKHSTLCAMITRNEVLCYGGPEGHSPLQWQCSTPPVAVLHPSSGLNFEPEIWSSTLNLEIKIAALVLVLLINSSSGPSLALHYLLTGGRAPTRESNGRISVYVCIVHIHWMYPRGSTSILF